METISTPAVTAPRPVQHFQEFDDAGITPMHWKIVLISGMGFFTDAYDLFIIGIVLQILTPLWNLNAHDLGLVGSTSLLAAAAGTVIFGRVADIFGRKRIYGVEVLILAIGAIASACSTSLWMLVACRAILGVGIGGDYPVSATIMSEYAGTKSRGLLVSLVFAMQGLGLIAGALLALGLLHMGLSSDLTWRLLLGFGAIPGLSVYLMRRNLKETPRFTALAHATTGAPTTAHDDGEPPPVQQSWADTIRSYRQHPPLLQWLVAASAAWFLLDIAYYGNTLSTPLIIHAIAPHATLIENLQITLGIFTLAAMPGYLLAAVMMDRMGRKTMQVVGFGVMALCFAGIALLPQAAPPLMIFIGLYGLSYFFAEFGPNTTTFVYPAEIFPSRVRTTSHGIAAMSGKIGAFLGTLLFPNLLKVAKLPGAMWVVAVVSLMGLATSLFLPEPNGKSLEALSGDNLNL